MEKYPTITPVVAAALSDGLGRWLMHRRPPGKRHAGLWEFPGGKVENGETPPVALIREIAEETNIALQSGSLEPAGFAWEPADSTYAALVILLYTACEWTGEPQALEGGELAWFDAASVCALPMPPLDRELARQLFGEPMSRWPTGIAKRGDAPYVAPSNARP